MAIKITDECINCGACEPECPNSAIYEGGNDWEFNGQTYGEGAAAPSGADGFFSNDFFYVVPDKCTECKGYHDEPQCIDVCPVDCCIPDPEHEEDEATLLAKKDSLAAMS
ncbi:MAG TPA: 4Fe-4S dicluster domain-containing protein [Ignavibacteriaceae bacterium]|nr:4Fe-4S dicluster domain-containing protein [Ignavibacteriaceae bacterium]